MIFKIMNGKIFFTRLKIPRPLAIIAAITLQFFFQLLLLSKHNPKYLISKTSLMGKCQKKVIIIIK